MAETVDHFIVPEAGQAAVLANDIAPLPANVCEAFIRAYAPAGGLVWDPFCRSDSVARVAARLGKRALLSDFNPLIAFIAGASLHPVTPRQLDRAVTLVGVAPVLQTTLAEHINALYATTCPMCGRAAVARSFTWSGDPPRLAAKELHCQTCSDMRRVPAGEEDAQALSRVEERGRAYWTLLERMGATEGALRPLGERLLQMYTPRALYALSTIHSKIEVLGIESTVRDVLMLALLDAMERCAKCTVDDNGRRQRLTLDRAAGARGGGRAEQFVELNCWQVFAESCAEQRARLERNERELLHISASLPSSRSRAGVTVHDVSDTATVLVRQASPRRVAVDLSERPVSLVLTAPPTLDWGEMLLLTYMWTGWLLGKDEARRFSPDYLLRPRRSNDWAFIYEALTHSMLAIAGTMATDARAVFCCSLTTLTYLNVLALAAAAAGLVIENIAYQPAGAESLKRPPALGGLAGVCYLRFARGRVPAADDAGDAQQSAGRVALGAAVRLLRERGEPAAYIWLYLAMLKRLSQTGALARLAAAPPGEVAPWERLRQIETGGLLAREGDVLFLPVETPAAAPVAADEAAPATGEAESTPDMTRRRGWWWLGTSSQAEQMLSDRVEWAIYTVLSTSPLSSTDAITRVVHALFPGLHTPDPGLLEVCLQSYARPASPIHWQLRPGEALAQRTREHTEMLALLAQLGHRLGYQVWISRGELHNRQHGPGLLHALSSTERYMNAEDLLPDATEHSQLIDVIWFEERRATHVFEIEWTAMLGESVLRRGTRAAGVQRFVVAPPERMGLIEAKVERLPHLARRLAEDGWRFLRFDVVRELAQDPATVREDVARRAGARLDDAPQGVQLALWS